MFCGLWHSQSKLACILDCCFCRPHKINEFIMRDFRDIKHPMGSVSQMFWSSSNKRKLFPGERKNAERILARNKSYPLRSRDFSGQSLADIWLSCYTLNLGQLSPAVPTLGLTRGVTWWRKGHTSYYWVELKRLPSVPFPKRKGLQELVFQPVFSFAYKEQHLRWYCTILARRIFNVAISMQQHRVCLHFFHFIISFNRKIWVPKKPYSGQEIT